MINNKLSFIFLLSLVNFLFIILLGNLSSALPIGSCTPNACPTGYIAGNIVCNSGVCYVNCTSYSSCNTTFTTVYNGSEYLPDINIPSQDGGRWSSFILANYTPGDTSKCYKFRQTTPNNFISSSSIYDYFNLNDFDSGIALYWDNAQDIRWYDNQRYFSSGENSQYIKGDGGGVWIDSCNDNGDDFQSADSFINSNYMYCAPSQSACNNLNSSYCDTDCYGNSADLKLMLTSDLENGLSCNTFSDFDNVGDGIDWGYIDYVNFASQTVFFYVDQSNAIINNSFINNCNYWSQCNPAEPCCDQYGYFRSNGYVCVGAHDTSCTNYASCTGTAHEDRCDGISSLCPDNNYSISYGEACNDITCVAQSCSGYNFQPQRTCSASLCQANDPYDCPNNLNCLDATSCKTNPSSSADCKTNYTYDSNLDICWFDNNKTVQNLIYDNNGNLINGLSLNYSYNNFNQLNNITINGSLVAEYFYDPYGDRIKSVEYYGSGNITTYYFDNFIQIANSSGVYNETYYYYYDRLMGKKNSNGNIFFYHLDYLGSTSLITDNAGNVVSNLKYEPFGDLINESDERYTFTGYEQDKESDLLYAKARYYNPEIAQFIQPDNVIGDIYNPQDLNKYSYVRNNPYKYTDPNGEFVEDIFFIGWDVVDIYSEGFTTLNTISLGVDILGLAVPFVGGGGRAIKGGSKAVDLAKGFDKVNDIRKIAEGTGKAISSADKIRDVGKSVDIVKGSSSSLKGAVNPIVSESISKGITKHNELTALARSQGLTANKAVFKDIGSKARPDVIDFQKGIITELKPNNPVARARGEKQLQRYTNLAKQAFPNIDWKGRLITYD